MDRKLLEEIKGLDCLETRSAKLSRKLRETPFLGVGLLGLVGACAVGALRFNKRAMYVPASFYLMQLRVAAQGTVVGSLAVGLAYTMCQGLAQSRSEE